MSKLTDKAFDKQHAAIGALLDAADAVRSHDGEDIDVSIDLEEALIEAAFDLTDAAIAVSVAIETEEKSKPKKTKTKVK
ncbi:MAG TPA: hypothetical protein VNZ53_26640 [Steroidobacteraceae bacterium]|jgi:hypothetical protein|nr:hypothetical protein [Steroidobacteraceae bacterium]